MENKRSSKDEDKENELMNEVKRLKKIIERQERDRYDDARDRDGERRRSYWNYYRQSSIDSRNEDRRSYSSRSISRDRYHRGSSYRGHRRNYDYSRERSRSRSEDRHSRRSRERSARSRSNISVDNVNTQQLTDPSAANQDENQHVQNPLIQTSTAPADKTEKQENDLNPDILLAIGERVHPERRLAPPVHSKFATGVEEVIKKGLPSEKKKLLLEKFLSPKNCLFMDPPKLNIELKASLQEMIVKRDNRISEKQTKITVSLAGILDVITKITNLKADEKVPIVELTEALWGIMQLVADLQYDESNIRRSLILKNINSTLKETLNGTSTDEWLFGDKLDDRVKAAKALETSGKSFKPSVLQTQSKNSKGPPRRQSYKPTYNMTSSGRRPYQKSKNPSQHTSSYSSRRSTQQKNNRYVSRRRD